MSTPEQSAQTSTGRASTLPLLTALTALGSVSVSMYLPSLPTLAQSLDATPTAVKMSLTAFLLVFACSQLVYGPLADRFGRTKPILGGLVVYVIGSAACSVAHSVSFLIGARVVQALGAAAGPALGRAVLRDLYAGQKLTSSLAIIAGAVALSPMLGPVAGGYLQTGFGWRATFYVLTAAGALLFVAVLLLLPESNTHIDKDGLKPGTIGRHYLSLFTDAEYVAALLCGGLLTAGNFAWTAGAPFLFARLYHFSASAYGNVALVVGAGYLLGTYVSAAMSKRLAAPRVVYAGIATSILAAAALLALSGAPHSWITIIGVMTIFTAGMGVVMPMSAACALSRHPEIAGAAAGLLGAMQILTGALGTIAVGLVEQVDLMFVAAVISVTATGALFAAYVALAPLREVHVDAKTGLA